MATLEVIETHAETIRYQYQFTTEDGETIAEGETHRKLEIGKNSKKDITVIDTWNDLRFFENAFYTAPFKSVLLPHHAHGKLKKESRATHIFKVKTPFLAPHEVVCMLGSANALGNWNTDAPTLLVREGEWWMYAADLSDEIQAPEYKYGVYNTKKEAFVRYEDGANRSLPAYLPATGVTVLHDGFVHLSNTGWKGSGVSVPVFSLRSENSLGVGEFTDLEPLADWAAQTGLKLIQVLPVNDTMASGTWHDSYPYAAISAFALHLIYINLREVAGKRQKKLVESVYDAHKQLNDLPEVDYEAVLTVKLQALRALYDADGGQFTKDKAYKAFFDENSHWLVPYGAFCFLRDKYNTADYSQWKTHQIYNGAEVDRLLAPKSKSAVLIGFYFFVQFHLHLQLQAAVAYLHKKRVGIKRRYSHWRVSQWCRYLDGARIIQHEPAGGRATGSLCREGSKLGLSHL